MKDELTNEIDKLKSRFRSTEENLRKEISSSDEKSKELQILKIGMLLLKYLKS